MAFWIAIVAVLAVAYLLGSLPTAYLAGRLFRGLDIRTLGSRSVGATNALRVLGAGPGLAVLLVDILKGAAAIAFARWVWSDAQDPAWTPWVASLAGLVALIGHSRSIWLRFSGGKSVATGLGVVLALAWPVALGALAVFALALAALRIVSLGSILAAVTAMVLVWVLKEPTPYRLLILVGGLYVVIRHRANIARLLAGAEPRLGQTPASH